jgi:hypothetical protein
VLRVLRKESPLGSQQTTHKKEVEKSGIYAHFFGLDGKKELTYAEFENFIKSLHQGVLQLEFDRYDSKGEGECRTRTRTRTTAHAHAHAPPHTHTPHTQLLEPSPDSHSFNVARDTTRQARSLPARLACR